MQSILRPNNYLASRAKSFGRQYQDTAGGTSASTSFSADEATIISYCQDGH